MDWCYCREIRKKRDKTDEVYTSHTGPRIDRIAKKKKQKKKKKQLCAVLLAAHI